MLVKSSLGKGPSRLQMKDAVVFAGAVALFVGQAFGITLEGSNETIAAGLVLASAAWGFFRRWQMKGEMS